MLNYCYSFLFFALGVAQLAGCIREGSGAGSLAFSPDGKQVCYLREDRIEENVVDGKTWLRSISLHWCNTNSPASERSVHIESLGGEFRSYSTVVTDLAWSPDGLRIGVLTPHKLVIVGIDTLKKIELRDDTITSFAWLSNTEVGYCSRRRKGNVQRRAICRQELGSKQPKEVVTFDWHPANEYTWQEHWAPSGQHVVFTESTSGGRLHVVNVVDGKSHALGQANAYMIGAAWAPDSRYAFCVSERIGPDDIFEALLIDLASGETVDCTAGFQATFAEHTPSLVPLWTVDGKYVIVNALDINGHLVQPAPWQAIPLGKTIASAFTPPTQWSSINPWLIWIDLSTLCAELPLFFFFFSPNNRFCCFFCRQAGQHDWRRLIMLIFVGWLPHD